MENTKIVLRGSAAILFGLAVSVPIKTILTGIPCDGYVASAAFAVGVCSLILVGASAMLDDLKK